MSLVLVPGKGSSFEAIVGYTLAQLRKEARLSQMELAECAGLKQASWSRIEAGRTALSVAQLRSVARMLGTMPSTILATAERLHLETERP